MFHIRTVYIISKNFLNFFDFSQVLAKNTRGHYAVDCTTSSEVKAVLKH